MSGEFHIAVLCGFVVTLVAAALTSAAIPASLPALRRMDPGVRCIGLSAFLAAPILLGLAAAGVVVATPHMSVLDLVPHHCHTSLTACVAHDPTSAPPALALSVIGAMVLGLLWLATNLVLGVRRSRETTRLLEAASEPVHAPGGPRVLATDAPIAVVAGMLRPRMFLGRGLLARLSKYEVEIVQLHEAVHIDRRDNLKRLIAAATAVGHFPGIRRRLLEELVLAQEQLCDRAAARRHGAVRTAEVLIKVERARRDVTDWGLCGAGFIDTPLTARVHALIIPSFHAPWRSGACLLLATLISGVALLAGAEPLHHLIEALFHNTHV